MITWIGFQLNEIEWNGIKWNEMIRKVNGCNGMEKNENVWNGMKMNEMEWNVNATVTSQSVLDDTVMKIEHTRQFP